MLRAVARGAEGRQDGLALADRHSSRQRDVLHCVAHGHVADRRGEAQRLLDDVAPGGPPLAHVRELTGIGEQGGDRVVDEVDRGLVPRRDHEQHRVDQFSLGQGRFAVLVVTGLVVTDLVTGLVVTGGDQRACHVVGRAGALEPDKVGQHVVDIRRGGHGLLGREGRVPDPVDGLFEAAPHVMGHAEEVADHPDGKLDGVGGAQVDDLFGAVVEFAEQRGRVPLDGRDQGREPAPGERRRDEPPQPAVRVSVGGEHVVHRHLKVQRPLPDDLALDEPRPVLARVLGDAGIRQELGQQVGIGYRPRQLTEYVDEYRSLLLVQHPFLFSAPARGGVEHERILVHRILHGVGE